MNNRGLGKFEKFCRLIGNWFEWIGLIGLLLMMFLICIDVIGAKLFLKPVFGAIDIVMLAQSVAISFSVPVALMLGRHVRVEFFVATLPARLQAAVEGIISLLGMILFGLIIWRLSILGYSFQTGGEGSATARIPLYPFAYGIAFASIPVSLVFLQKFLDAMIRLVKR
ncbi:MAG: TRAP transporter small permease [Desulfobacterales bacterium]